MDLDDEELKATRMMNGADRNSRVRVNNDIKANEYVRTTNGKIAKYIGYNKELELHMFDKGIKWHYEYYTDIFEEDEFNEFINKDIVKHSKQLIDLIEVGDVVNGMEVLDIHKPRDLWEPIEIRVDSRYENFILVDDIKTILTKEQFEANCYKVGGENGI